MEEKRCAIALSRLRGISLAASIELYQKFGSAREVFDRIDDVQPKWQTPLRDAKEAFLRADVELEFCEKNRIQVLTPDSASYPMRLKECCDAPLVLFYKGTADLNAVHSLSIVGTRRITDYGKDFCIRLCRDLAQIVPDCLIISGLAYGVDIEAHRASLESGLDTIGVLAHGMDRIYPAIHRHTAAQMTAQGGLLTEYLTGTIPDKGNFVRRNRIIAGCSAATVVIESAAKGGALITASLASDYNRDVFAVPGRVGDKYSEGCNALIRDCKATLITSAEDLAQALLWRTEKEKREQPIQRQLFPELDDFQQRICHLLKGTDGVGIDRMAVLLDASIQDLTASLFDLEMIGIVRPLSGGKYKLIG